MYHVWRKNGYLAEFWKLGGATIFQYSIYNFTFPTFSIQLHSFISKRAIIHKFPEKVFFKDRKLDCLSKCLSASRAHIFPSILHEVRWVHCTLYNQSNEYDKNKPLYLIYPIKLTNWKINEISGSFWVCWCLICNLHNEAAFEKANVSTKFRILYMYTYIPHTFRLPYKISKFS